MAPREWTAAEIWDDPSRAENERLPELPCMSVEDTLLMVEGLEWSFETELITNVTMEIDLLGDQIGALKTALHWVNMRAEQDQSTAAMYERDPELYVICGSTNTTICWPKKGALFDSMGIEATTNNIVQLGIKQHDYRGVVWERWAQQQILRGMIQHAEYTYLEKIKFFDNLIDDDQTGLARSDQPPDGSKQRPAEPNPFLAGANPNVALHRTDTQIDVSAGGASPGSTMGMAKGAHAAK